MNSAAVFAVIAAPALAGNVLVVDSSGGGAFTTIQSAVDAAADGDTILVKSGFYQGFTVNDRAVAVVADTNALVQVGTLVRVDNLASSRDALLVGLRIFVDVPGNYGVQLRHNMGSVRVEDCRLENLGYVGEAAWVVNSQDVAYARCTIVTSEPRFPGDALHVDGNPGSSNVAVYDSELRGGDGADLCSSQWDCQPPDGGSGAVVRSGSFFFAAGSLFHGGEGGRGSQYGCGLFCGSDGGWGGDGVRFIASGAAALLDNGYHAGHGAPTCSPCSSNLDGGNGVEIGGSPTMLDGRARHLSIKNPRRERIPFRIEARGRPGDSVILYSSESTGFTYMPSRRGVLIPQNPTPPIQLGTIPANGILVYHHTVPDLGPGVQSKRIYFQALHTTPAGVKFLGSPVSLVVLDQAF
jgi:hypothetical protein